MAGEQTEYLSLELKLGGRKAKRHQPYYNQYHTVNSNRVTFCKKLKTDRRNLRSHLDSTTAALKNVGDDFIW